MLARYSLLCHGSVVYPSVTSRSSTETAERIELGFFLGGGRRIPSTFLHCIIQKFRYLQSKSRPTSVWMLVPYSELCHFYAISPMLVDRCKCCQLSSIFPFCPTERLPLFTTSERSGVCLRQQKLIQNDSSGVILLCEKYFNH